MKKFLCSLLVLMLVASPCACAQDKQKEEVTVDEDVRFLKWYILLSDSASAEIQGFVQTDVSFAFLLSNQNGSPTADGHYEGKSCYTWQTNYDTAKVKQGKTTGYDFYALNAQSCSVELIPDPLNQGKLTGEFSVAYSGKQDWDITGSIGGGSKNASGVQGYTETARVKMIVDLFKSTDKGGNQVTLYYVDPAYPEYHAIPMYGYLFSSDELSQEEFDDYMKKLDERVEKESKAETQTKQQKASLESQLEDAKKWHDYNQKAAEEAAAKGDSERAKYHSGRAEAERQRIARIEKLLGEL